MRYLGIDLARSVAILFVILGHAMMGANVQHGGAALPALWLFLSLSAPVFFCLFGCMLQLVYARQYANGRQDEIVQRLLTRAFQCWVLYAITCAAMCVASDLPFTYFLRCALLLGDTPYTDILKFYAFLLLASPLLIKTSVRFGLWPLVGACLAVQLAFPLISHIPAVHGFPGSGTLSAFLYGGAYQGHTGPSVIHGLGFVVFGMLLGRIWQHRPGQEFLLSGPDHSIRAAFALLLSATFVWAMAGDHNLLVPAERIELRNTNHPLYLLAGCCAAVIFIEVFGAVRRFARISPDSVVMLFGRTSLFTFCFGNILLYFVRLRDPAAPADPGLAIVATAAVMSLGVLYYHFRESSWVRSDNPSAKAYRWVADDSLAAVVGWIMNFSKLPAKVRTG